MPKATREADPQISPSSSAWTVWLRHGLLLFGSATVVWAAVRWHGGEQTPASPPAAPDNHAAAPEKTVAAPDNTAEASDNNSAPRADDHATTIAGKFADTVLNNSRPPSDGPEGMVWIPGGEFSMGCNDPRGTDHGGLDSMRDTRPIHRVFVDDFWMDATEVTNQQFAKFVAATDYVTIAERTPQAEDFPGAPPENLVAGSVVFSPPDHPVGLENHFQWWSYVQGANWRHPTGPQSDLQGRENYPVVQVGYDDAAAYAKWSGKRLPTEAEWEFAARGGLTGQPYAWGAEFKPNQKWPANIWQGKFPVRDTGDDGFVGIAPVGRFPANNFGLFDVAGNVWEWCSDWYRPDYYETLASSGEVARNPLGPATSFDPAEPNQAKRVQRGGSFLCTEQYCTRYMIGTRGKGDPSTGTNHLGFRCVAAARQAR